MFIGRTLENHHKEQKESYETQVEGLRLKVDHLQNENSKLQNLFQEKSDVNEYICQEVARLSSENSVGYCIIYSTFVDIHVHEVHNINVMTRCCSQLIPELKLQVSELQRQKQELDGLVKEQNKELAGSFPFCVSKNLTVKFLF